LGRLLLAGVNLAADQPATRPARGPSFAPLGFLLGLIIVVGAGAGMVVTRRRRAPTMLTTAADLSRGDAIPARPLPVIPDGRARLTLDSATGDDPEEVQVGTAPMAIGW